MDGKIGSGAGEAIWAAKPLCHGNLTNPSRAAKVSQSIHSGLALTGANHRAMPLIGGVIDVEALILRRPGGPVTTKHQVVLDGQLQSGRGELALDRGECGEPAAIGQAL